MSLERGCRERLEQTEDGRRALAVLDSWEQRVALLDLVRAICELRTSAYRDSYLAMILPPPRALPFGAPSEVVRPWRELGFVEICATLGVEWLPNEWKQLQAPEQSEPQPSDQAPPDTP